MQFSQLALVRHRVSVGKPLPFNVRNADHTLLLARGHVVDTFDQMEALFTRGALVDLAELRSPEDTSGRRRPNSCPSCGASAWTASARRCSRARRKASARRWTRRPARCRR